MNYTTSKGLDDHRKATEVDDHSIISVVKKSPFSIKPRNQSSEERRDVTVKV